MFDDKKLDSADAVFTNRTTVREALKFAFRENWDNRRVVSQHRLAPKSSGDAFRVILTPTLTVPMELAKEVLDELMAEEAAAAKTKEG